MISAEDIVDLVWESLKENRPGHKAEGVPGHPGRRGLMIREPYNRPYTSLPTGRVFFSEYDIKRMIQGDQVLRLPRGAIVSPLAQEWLTLKRVRIIREDDHERQ